MNARRAGNSELREMDWTFCACPNPAYLTSPTRFARHIIFSRVPRVALVARPAGAAPPFHLHLRAKKPLYDGSSAIEAVCSTNVTRDSSLSRAVLRTAPIALHRQRHAQGPQSTPDQTASRRSYPAKKPGKRGTTHASLHQ